MRLEQTEWFQQGGIPDRGGKPDAVWVALPCGPTSSIQGLNKLTPEGMEKVQAKVAKSRKLAGRAVTPMELQVVPGGEVIQEWPRYNKGWKFNCVQTFWNRREHHEAITKPMPMAVPMDFVHQVVELSRHLGDSGGRHVAFGTCNDFANVKNHMFLVNGVIPEDQPFTLRGCVSKLHEWWKRSGDLVNSSFAVSDATDCDMDCL